MTDHIFDCVLVNAVLLSHRHKMFTTIMRSMHIHRNPHHWQHWVLINDEPKEGTILIEMPYPYIIEMICDWWAFSWIKGDLSEMFAWYKDHADYIKMHNNTRSIVEEILEMIRTKLTEVENAEN